MHERPEATVDDLGLVGPGTAPDLDNLTALAQGFFDLPVSLVSIVQPELDRQYFASSIGLGEPWRSARQTPLSHSFCKHVVADDRPLVVTDARRDPLVADNGAVDDLGVVAYLGVPIYRGAGPPVGALCVIGHRSRTWSDAEVDVLRRLGSCVSDAIRSRALVFEHEATRAQLERVQDRLDDAVAAGGVGLWERDLDTGEFWLSDMYDRLHGGGTDSWRGLPSLVERFHPDDRRELGPVLLADREADRTYEWVYRFRMGDGTYRWMRSTSRLSERPGRASRLAGATVDITAERQREERIAAMNVRLADTNESLNEFVRIASHDLRAPLRSIQTLISFTRDDQPDLPDELAGHLDVIAQRASHMTGLLDDLFRYLVVGTTEPESTVTDLELLAKQVFALIDAPDHIELAVEANVVSARVDGFALSTVIRNLVDNAVKHSRDRPGRVRVRFDHDPADPRRLVVAVEDTGPGIPKEYLERIFQPFYTLDRPEPRKGSGMGLAIVRRLIQRAEGAIDVTSSVGRGSTFRVTWPATDLAPSATRATPFD